jgi:hypothetical protein
LMAKACKLLIQSLRERKAIDLFANRKTNSTSAAGRWRQRDGRSVQDVRDE